MKKTSEGLRIVLNRIAKITEKKGWDKSWSPGGCYIHLEVSEFIESLRGKGDDSPEKEAADVIVALFAVLAHYNLSVEEIFDNKLEEILFDLERD